MNNIKQNLEILLAAVEAQPETLFDLDAFRQDEPCGTLYCTAGLAATLPYFQCLGLKLDDTCVWTEVTGKGVDVIDGGGDYLFGENSWYNLFTPPGEGRLDALVGYKYEGELVGKHSSGCGIYKPNMSDKELAIARLKEQIGQYSDE